MTERRGPRTFFGFVEPYHDPRGIRAEFEGLVAIADDEETRLLAKLFENSATFIRRLPWATSENDGKGPFKKSLFEPPDFSSIHFEYQHDHHLQIKALAYCSSIVFPGINLPNVSPYANTCGGF
jgi:dipeptidyl-peptidase-3